MIRVLTPGDQVRLARAAERARPGDPLEAAGRILCLAAAYGLSRPFVRFWSGEAGAFVSLLDGQAVAVPSRTGEGREELAVFLAMQPEIREVRSTAAFGRFLAERNPETWTGGKTGEVMTPGEPVAPPARPVEALTPRELYPLLQSGFGEGLPPFEGWYPDVSHRLRHGLCRVAGIRENGIPAASAMTVAEWPGGALIGAVATRPDCRRRGLASVCVTALTAALQAEGRRVLLSPKNDHARRLYARLGFLPFGDWGSVIRSEEPCGKERFGL